MPSSPHPRERNRTARPGRPTRRDLLRVVAALPALALGPVTAAPAGAAAPTASPTAGPTARPTARSTVALTGSALVGVAAGGPLLWLDDADLARELDVVSAAGAGWLRVDVDWSHVERERGTLDWASTDRVVDAARSRGLRVLGLLTYAPVWAQAQPGSGAHPAPLGTRDLAAFARAAALRYPGRVSAWEVWNEPNLPQFWSPRPDPVAYAALLTAAATALHAAAPGVPVLAGGLAPGVDGGDQVSPVTFVQRLYDLGAAQAVDALAVHPYSYPAMPGDTSTASWNTFQRLALVRRTVVENGDGAKRVWLTEFGAPTGTAAAAVTEARQAAILDDGLRRAAALPWVGPLFVYCARDAGVRADDPEQNFGLVRHDFTHKPAVRAVRRASRFAARRSARASAGTSG